MNKVATAIFRTLAIGMVISLALNWNNTNEMFWSTLPFAVSGVLFAGVIIRMFSLARQRRAKKRDIDERVAVFKDCPLRLRREILQAHFAATIAASLKRGHLQYRIEGTGQNESLLVMMSSEPPPPDSRPLTDGDAEVWADKLAEQHVKTLSLMDENLDSALAVFIESELKEIQKPCEH